MGGPYTSPPIKVVSPKRARKTSSWLVVLTPVLLFVYLSTRPVMRLKREPPAEFLDLSADGDADRRVAEKHLAAAYWDCALHSIRVKYPFGATLPDEPPVEFKSEEKGFQRRSSEAVRSARQRYWQKIRKVWGLPHTWQKSYEWNTDWIRLSFVAFRESAGNVVSNLLRRFKT